MSLILEALKKSEQQRRIGEVPNLGTPVIGTRRRRSMLPILALLIVVALATGAWMLFAPSHTGQPGSATPTEPAGDDLATSDVPGTSSRAAPIASNKAPAQVNPQPTRTLSAYERERLRVTGQLPEVDRKPRPPVSRPVPPRPAPAAPAPAASAPPPPTAPAKPAAPATPRTTTPPTGTAPGAGTAPAPVPYLWELPFASRKDLPPLQISMHVYADDPKQRFVVIDGESYVEGDDLGEGLAVREIRADGVVLEVAGKAYLLPASGR